ncbi:MAG: hypothetical protein PVJ30_09555 [Thiohalocapsa sp.]
MGQRAQVRVGRSAVGEALRQPGDGLRRLSVGVHAIGVGALDLQQIGEAGELLGDFAVVNGHGLGLAADSDC